MAPTRRSSTLLVGADQVWVSAARSMLLLLVALVAPAYVRLGVRPAPLHSRTAAVARADALPLEALPLELQPQQPYWTAEQLRWSAERSAERSAENPQPADTVAAVAGEAAPESTLVRVLYATALGLEYFPPLATLACLASVGTTLTLGRWRL